MNFVPSDILWYVSTGSVWLIMGNRLAGCLGFFLRAHKSLGMDRILISVITKKKNWRPPQLPHHLVGWLLHSAQLTLCTSHEPTSLEEIRQPIWQTVLWFLLVFCLWWRASGLMLLAYLNKTFLFILTCPWFLRAVVANLFPLIRSRHESATISCLKYTVLSFACIKRD